MDPPLRSNAVTDPTGRAVVLDAAGWRHIRENHPEMADHRAAVLATVRRPDHRRPDPRPGRERYYRRGIGPSRWCLVVVDFTRQPARVVTAFATRRDPEGWRRP
jgi:hypothetical protein